MLYNPVQRQRELQTVFLKSYAEGQDNLVSKIATTIKSTGASEIYSWMGESPLPQDETKQELVFHALSDGSLTVENVAYSAGIALKKDDFDDDKTGALHLRIQQLAVNAKKHANKLLVDHLINGTSTSAPYVDYTGAAFFKTAHAIRGQQSATQSNLLTGTGETVATIKVDVGSALQNLVSMQDEAGQPFNEDVSEVAVVCHPLLAPQFREVLFGALISNTSNVGFGEVKFHLISTARLSDSDDWYMLNVGGGVRPLIWQERTPLEFKLQEEGDAAFTKNIIMAKVRYRAAVAFAHWQNAVKVTNT